MFIDIIMPFKNEEKYISLAISSLLTSKIVGKIILIDDNSTDKSWNICSEIKQKNSKKINLIKNTKIGKVSAINLGFKKVINKFVWLVDADDEVQIPLNFTKYDLNENYILDVNIFYIYANKKIKLMKKRKLNIKNYNNYIRDLIIFPKASFIMPKKFCKTIFPIDERCPFEDIWISYNIWLKKYKIIRSNKILYKYRQHNANTFGNATNYSRDLIIFRYNRIDKGIKILKKKFQKSKYIELLKHAHLNTKFILGKMSTQKFLINAIKINISLKTFIRFYILRHFPKLIQIYKKIS